MKMRTVRYWLNIVVLIVALFALIGTGLNQWGGFLHHGHEMGVARDCLIDYAALSVVVSGEAYCYKVHLGELYIAPLEKLKSATKK